MLRRFTMSRARGLLISYPNAALFPRIGLHMVAATDFLSSRQRLAATAKKQRVA